MGYSLLSCIQSEICILSQLLSATSRPLQFLTNPHVGQFRSSQSSHYEFHYVIHSLLVHLRQYMSVNKPPSVMAAWQASYRHSKSPHSSDFQYLHHVWGSYYYYYFYNHVAPKMVGQRSALLVVTGSALYQHPRKHCKFPSLML